MPEIPLVVDAGRTHGSAASRRLRAGGRIPAIVYGHGIEPIPVSVDGRALRTALGTEAGTNALLRLEMDGVNHLALAREIQRHPVRHTVTHVDFQVVSRDEIVHADVNLVLVGEAEAVHKGDGMVDQETFTVAVKAKPADLPSHFEISIEGLEIGQTIRLSDLNMPAGVTTDLDPETVLVVAHPPKGPTPEEIAAEEEAAAEAEAAGTGGAEGEGAGGEAAPAAEAGSDGGAPAES
jgi:large subunit ribosomal protein L25